MPRTHYSIKRGSYKVRAINIGVCPCLESDDILYITLISCLAYDFYIYGAFEFFFYAIPFLIYDVMYDITTTLKGTLL